jgi:Arc/MetJ-type ribon-helix-helix transcriptional regulator
MTITLPDEMAVRVEALAKRHGFASATDYLATLVEEAEIEDMVANMPGPPGLSPRNRAELEAMLEAGLNSGPPIRVTPEFWEERKRELEARMAKRRGEAP